MVLIDLITTLKVMKRILLLFYLSISLTVSSQTPVFEWVNQLGGPDSDSPQQDIGFDLVTDAAGNVYVTGNYSSTGDFDPGPGQFTFTSNGASDAYIAKYDPDGNLVWAVSVGGVGVDRGDVIALDQSGNVFVAGRFHETVDFDPGPDVFNLQGSFDNFILKLNTDDGSFVWAKALNGGGSDLIDAITFDKQNNFYITGGFGTTLDIDPGMDVFSLVTNGLNDIFIAKFSEQGELIWAKSIGGIQRESGAALTLDNEGNLYATGLFNDIVDFDPGLGEFNLTEIGTGDGDQFILKLNNDGEFVWANSIGGGTLVVGGGIVANDEGSLYLTGLFQGGAIDFDPGVGEAILTSNFMTRSYVAKYDIDGNLVWVKPFGSDASQITSEAIAIDEDEDIYITGQFSQTIDFDPGPGVFNLSSPINHDAFILKLNSEGQFVWAGSFAGTDYDVSFSIAVDQSKNIFTTGYFKTSVDFDPGSEVFELETFGTISNADAFVHKLCQLNCNTTSIQTIASDAYSYLIYPNPTKDVMNFSLQDNHNYQLKLYDALGRQLWVAKYVDNDIQIPTDRLPEGIYWLNISIDTNQFWEKIEVLR